MNELSYGRRGLFHEASRKYLFLHKVGGGYDIPAYLTLPKPDHPPPFAFERIADHRVPANIPLNLFPPVLLVLPKMGSGGIDTLLAQDPSMPEIAIDEHDKPFAPEHNVWLAGQKRKVLSKAVPPPVQNRAKFRFRLSADGSYRRHIAIDLIG